jgi:RND family efflux transporter MFP subunit
MNNEPLKTETAVSEIANSSVKSPAMDGVAPASRRAKAVILGGAIVATVLVLSIGIVPRVRAHEKLAQVSKESVQPSVVVTNVSRSAARAEVVLPANVKAFEEASLYARADGYLTKWMVDIGGKVAAGQVLAEIDTPDLDQELNQSRATLAQSRANLALARSTAARWQGLLKDRAVSQQEVDEKAGALAAREADLNAAEAAVRRLEQLTSYKQIIAPFAGIVTRRNVDTGALIVTGRNGGGSPLFELAQISTLRVFVDVPQAHMRDVTVDLPVEIRVAEFPDRTFTGKVVRTAGALNASTRTLLTEVQVDNRDGALMPGIHAEVKLSLNPTEPPVVVPGTAVIIRGEGTMVAVVDPEQIVHLKPVRLGRDLGTSIEVVSGLAENTTIVLNPADTLKEGTRVNSQAIQKEAKSSQLAKK